MRQSLRVVLSACLGLLVAASVGAEKPGAPDPAPGVAREGGGPGGEIQRMEVSTAHLNAYRRRAEQATAMADVDAAIAALEQLLKELIEERRGPRDERQKAMDRIAAAKRELADVEGDIRDVEAAIAVSQAALPGSVSPDLAARLRQLKTHRSSLREELARLETRQREADDDIARIDDLMKDAELRLQEKREAKRGLQAEMAKVSITAPSRGARLLVGSTKELRLRADNPPQQVRIEVQKLGSDEGGDGGHGAWETAYARIWEWKDLESGGPNAAVMRFKTVEAVSGHSLSPDPSVLRLGPGNYRARVGIVDAEWRHFTVVGKLGSDALGRDSVPRPGGNAFRHGASTKQGMDAAPPAPGVQKTDDSVDTKILRPR